MLLEKVKCNYVLKPERMGLIKDVDFSVVKFVTIMSTSGKILLESAQVSKPGHLRIRIRPDLGY